MFALHMFLVVLTSLIGLHVSGVTGMGARASNMLIHDQNPALIQWQDFEQFYTVLFAIQGDRRSPGEVRDHIRLTLETIPKTPSTAAMSKEDIDIRKGATKVVELLNSIPDISNSKDCDYKDLSLRILLTGMFNENIHVNTFLSHYNSLYYTFCINSIDQSLIRSTNSAEKILKIPPVFDEIQKSYKSAAEELPGSPSSKILGRALILFLRNKQINVEQNHEDPVTHLERISKLVDQQIYKPLQCAAVQTQVFDDILVKYRLISIFKSELSDDSKKWVDLLDICDQLRSTKKQLILIDLYEEEAAETLSGVFALGDSPELQELDVDTIEENINVVIDVLKAKKRVHRDDNRVLISKLEDFRFELPEDTEICNLINVRKLQQLMSEYVNYPNALNYLNTKARELGDNCKESSHSQIDDIVKTLDKQQVKRLANLRKRIEAATPNNLVSRLFQTIPVENFIRGTLAYLLSGNFQAGDGFEIIADKYAPKVSEDVHKLQEGAHMFLGSICDEIESKFDAIKELFNELDKLGIDWASFNKNDRDWLTNVNVCVMIKFPIV